MAIKIRCKDHPTYSAKEMPRVMCNACWYVFHVAHHITTGNDKRLQIKRGKRWPRKKRKADEL